MQQDQIGVMYFPMVFIDLLIHENYVIRIRDE